MRTSEAHEGHGDAGRWKKADIGEDRRGKLDAKHCGEPDRQHRLTVNSN